ncbi:hypothetical protein A2738_02765 [Candidatus Nomurabacteria bacterium RIFCSPHIGHO2_01_FULL_42_15]|uniref:Uncharacterized protein n=1 Tax=Candidatus Nomurabacteria bacterium RIFCSPHIGHO2_01_FULL_42_15 TaxID=1801742 RepID=A0A1F6VEK6_9BACT|nr:MAG: hypothetical protein A2738_02765 [Candidatus Nomurabacteria bacterium RIFCSPHIGHO2_01_FULL_42_15]OGI92791.1 MAG: hypothetical protein A3A99_02830 [Candidatus Nomurabacteria bacterium RIFCSPLOWO2_01_FULL_41_18]
MLFLVVLFLIKNTSTFKNTETFLKGNKQDSSLVYGDMTFEDLVNEDTDGDGVLDWQEGLYDLDPTKSETTPGVLDSVAIQKLKSEQEGSLLESDNTQNVENLTQTDKFSRELFAIVAATSQNGVIDQTTIDTLGSSLAEKIQNSVPRKIYVISDIKIIESDIKEAIQKYSNELANIYTKYNIKKGVMNILEEFIADETNTSILLELDPIINQLNEVINESVKMQVPKSLSLIHLDLINSFQRVLENINDIKLFDSDIVVAMGAIIQYQQNTIALESSLNRLTEAVRQKLNN